MQVERQQKKSAIGVGKRAKVFATNFGTDLVLVGKRFQSVKKPYPCVCESINDNGVAVLRFDANGTPLYECFRLGDPALDVEWRD